MKEFLMIQEMNNYNMKDPSSIKIQEDGIINFQRFLQPKNANFGME